MQGKIILHRGKEYSIQRFHPWIFSGAIQSTEGTLSDGCWVDVFTSKGGFLGSGHYQKGSITVRMLTFAQAPAEDFWAEKFRRAFKTRRTHNIPSAETDAYRLVHGEGDGLPGLIIDVYNGVAVVQAHSAGMHVDREPIASALKEVLPDLTAIYYKNQGSSLRKEENKISDEYLFGMSALPHLMHENGKNFLVDWEEGQKTGFFLD